MSELSGSVSYGFNQRFSYTADGVVMGKSYLPKKKSATREWIECVFVAIILALLIKTLLFEVFKIPSGSMRPVLFGAEDRGDRILVNRMAYSFGSKPERWDVMVFISPTEKHQNFIKRVIGRPGEKININNGDIYIDGEIATKPLHVLKAMRRCVYSEDFNAPRKNTLDLRRTESKEDTICITSWLADKPGWKVKNKQLFVETEGQTEITYSRPISDFHLAMKEKGAFYIPGYGLFKKALNMMDGASSFDSYFIAKKMTGRCPDCETDFILRNDLFVFFEENRDYGNDDGGALYVICPVCGNAEFVGHSESLESDGFVNSRPDILPEGFIDEKGTTWAAENMLDIMVEFNLEPLSDAGIVKCVLNKTCILKLPINEPLSAGNVSFEGEIIPLNSKMVLEQNKDYLVEFGYVDHRIHLYINGEKILLASDREFKKQNKNAAGSVAINVASAKLYLDDIKIFTDIYYHYGSSYTDGNGKRHPAFLKSAQSGLQLADDEYFMMGDNSRNSNDSRAWGPLKTKDTNPIIGKAVYVWWPPSHAKKIN